MGFCSNHCITHDSLSEVNFMSLLSTLLISEFILGCFSAARRRQRCTGNIENNKEWLLGESGGTIDGYSGQSSFRFSLCSQVELESMPVNRTVLILNLNNDHISNRWLKLEGFSFGWQRMQKGIPLASKSLVRFSYAQIRTDAGNFSQDRVLGKGALSDVFKGKLGILQTPVAIKRLDKDHPESLKAFCRELMIASSLCNHRRVVPLIGFCMDNEDGLFLVYKYVAGGTLEQLLHGKNKGGMTLFQRYKVAIGIAKAIDYLHNGTGRCVVHRDIKPSNILVSSRKSPKLCDLGLATWTTAPSVPFFCKTVKGTFGYLAPEYFQLGKVSNKTDVYAFGVVLLELVSGRKPHDSIRGSEEKSMVHWAMPFLEQGNVEKLVDPRLKISQKNKNKIHRMVCTTSACISHDESKRPEMGNALAMLRGSNSCVNYFNERVNQTCFIARP